MTLFFENMRLALSSLKANKMRALLTMLGIIIGISSVIAIMTVGDSISKELTSTLSGFGVNNIDVALSVRDDYEGDVYITDDDCITKEMVMDMGKKFEDKIAAISYTIEIGDAQVTEEEKYANITLGGCSLGTFMINDTKLVAGRYFTLAETDSASKVAIVSDRFVENMFEGDNDAALGSVVKVELDGKLMQFSVVGIYEYEDMMASMGITSGKDVRTSMYIPLQTAENIVHTYFLYYFQVMTKEGVDQNALVKDIGDYMTERYYRNNEMFCVEAQSMASMIEEVSSLTNKLTVGIAIIAGIALLVGGIGVMNIMLVSITERTREIGTRKALGAPNSSIRTQFIVESIVICLIGGIIGIILGCGLGMLAAKLLECPVAPSVRGIIISLTFSTAIGIFFGYYPANKAAKMDPIEALRYE